MLEKDAYVFVYSMTSQNTVKELEHFSELHEHMNENRQVPIILVATKKDLIKQNDGTFRTITGGPVEWIKEESYFFKLSAVSLGLKTSAV